MSWTTVSTTLPTVDANNLPITLTVLTLDPPNTSTAPTTWYISESQTVESYVTFVDNIPTPVVSTLPSEPESTQTDTTDSPSDTTTSTATEISSTTSSTSTTTNTNTATTQTPGLAPPHPSTGISNGALAGAIVGSIIGTALVTLLLAILFFRRRQTHPARELETQTQSTTPSAPASTRFIPIITPTRHKKSSPALTFPLASITPHPADDDAVRSRILTVLDQAALHIDNYYVPASSPAHLSPEQSARLAGYDSTDLPASVESLVSQRGLQRHIITHVLVRTLLTAIVPGEPGGLLPGVMAAQPVIRSDPDTDKAVFTWRMLTAHLYKQSPSDSTTTARDAAAKELATLFTFAFAPYSFPSFTGEERLSHLRTLAVQTAELGVWLFAQPCVFEFSWERGEGEVVVLPRVVKVVDEVGRRIGLDQGVVVFEGERVGLEKMGQVS
ncbi:hypothetical protein BJX76DRAFT_360110 [Aspergillus varians]